MAVRAIPLVITLQDRLFRSPLAVMQNAPSLAAIQMGFHREECSEKFWPGLPSTAKIGSVPAKKATVEFGWSVHEKQSRVE